MPDWFMDIKLPVLLCVGTLMSFLWLLKFREKLNIGYMAAFVLSILHTIVGVACVKLFAFLEGADLGAMSIFGATFFLPVIYFFGAKLTKRKMADVFDIFAVCTTMVLACARVNCLLSGCCGGRVIPWLNGLHWPTQWIEIIFYIALSAVFWRMVGKEKYSGMIYPIYLTSYGCLRFLLEFVRQKDTINLLHLSHAWAIVSILVGGAILGELQNRKVRKRERSKEK